MKIPLKTVLKPALSLFVICLGVTILLAVTQSITEKKIEQRLKQTVEDTCRTVLSQAVSFEDIKDNAVRGKDSAGNTVGYVITVTQKGYGGEMKVMVGLNEDGSVSGVSVLSHNETPGLGARAAEPGFLEQFKGLGKHKEFTVGENIDKISGATISSKAVTSAVNNALAEYKNITGGDNNGK